MSNNPYPYLAVGIQVYAASKDTNHNPYLAVGIQVSLHPPFPPPIVFFILIQNEKNNASLRGLRGKGGGGLEVRMPPIV